MSINLKSKKEIKKEKEEQLKSKYLYKEQLINFVRENPVLYDTRLEIY
jgi:hypothetical protein